MRGACQGARIGGGKGRQESRLVPVRRLLVGLLLFEECNGLLSFSVAFSLLSRLLVARDSDERGENGGANVGRPHARG